MGIHNFMYHVNGIHLHDNIVISQLVLTILLTLGIVSYLVAVIHSNQRYKQWPLYRTGCLVIGVCCAAIAMIGPLAERAQTDFTAHMFGHLLLGMLAPLLIALAAPMTLVMRTLSVPSARRLSRILKSPPVRIVNKPVIAAALNMGGLWVLYATDLYAAMHQQIILHLFIHVHVFLAGYIFTISIIYIDPTPHRTSYLYRSIVLVAALASHSILSKYIYAHPPSSVPVTQAETGAMLMYYGGDVIDLFIIFILCLQWYKATKPRHQHPIPPSEIRYNSNSFSH